MSDVENPIATTVPCHEGSLSNMDRHLFDRVNQRDPRLTWNELDTARLREITAEEGIDFATAALYLGLRRSAEHGRWIDRFENQDVTSRSTASNSNLLVGIVPGGCHEESEDSRRGLQRVHDEVLRSGLDCEVVPVHSFGCLPDQATAIGAWLAKHSQRTVVIVSLSKGTAEVKLAMRDDPLSFGHVRAWVNVSGLIYGSQWVNWLLNRPLSRWSARVWCWYWNYPFMALRQLARGPNTLMDFELNVPDHLEIIHVYGFPSTDRLSHAYTRRSHMRLATDGPSDGMGVMLGDLVRLPGRIYPVWGADHFLRIEEFDFPLFVSRALHYVIAGLSCQGHGDER